MIFNRDTVLYHPTEGKKLFPQGEQHPGPAWFDNPKCLPEGQAPETGKALKDALKEVARLEDALGAAGSQISGQAAAHEAELAARDEAHAAALADKDAKIAQLEADVETLVAQRDAAAKAAPAPEPEGGEEAPPISPPDNDGDGNPGGSEPDPEEEKAEKAKIRAEIKGLGFGEVPGPRASIEAFRAALDDAKAAARKAAE